MMNLKRPNKRTVFCSDSDSENEGKHQRKRRKNAQPAQILAHIPKQKPESFNPNMFYIPIRKLIKSSLWPQLEIRGPYHELHFLFQHKTIENQPLCKLLRQLLIKIHGNANDYREKTIPTIIERFDKKTPTVDDAITIAEDMCRRVFRFRDDYAYPVNLYENNMISPIKEMLFAKELNVDCNTKTEILQRLQLMCESKNVDVTAAQLEDVRNGFVYYIFESAVELLPCIFSINVFLYPGKLSSYRAAKFSMSKNFHKITDWYSKPPRLRSINPNLLYRKNKVATLWLLIPCELKHHLLEHVLEYGLMELLPKEARSLLSRWIIDVRKRMRKRLTKGDLSNKIGQYMSAVDKNEQLSPDDARIEGVISAVLENALNSKDFKVFDGEWKNFTLNLIKTMDRHQFLDISSRADILREVCQNMHPASLQRLSSCFSNSETDKTLLSHTLHQVLHFTIRFALSTLRHAFRINGQLRIRFDGYMEEVVTDFSDYSRSTSPEIDFVVVPNSEDTPQSSECQKPLPTIQVIRPRKTLLPTPVHQSPLASHLDDFYQRMPPSDYKVSPIQNTCSIYSARGPVLFDAQQFEPRSAQHLEGDGKKSFFSFSSGVNTTKQPKAESFNDSSLSEEKKVEVPKAKALRQPSVSSFTQIDDFEGLPDEWVIEYKAALDTNTKLLAELDRAKARLDAILK